MGDNTPCMDDKRQVSTENFFAEHPVFSLAEATRALNPPRGRAGAVERLKHHLATGRLKRVGREVYAVVPRGRRVDVFLPDPFLVARVIRPNGVFCHHSALELLGVAHSVWNQVTLFGAPRRALETTGWRIQCLGHPSAFRGESAFLGTRQVERQGVLLRVTGPERTLVEGFSRLDRCGGLEELTVSADGFPVLDLDLLESVLKRYAIAGLWAATGWFLERRQALFHVPEDFLARLEARRPRAPQYLLRSRRGGRLAARWNLILPPEAGGAGEPDGR